MKKKSKKMNKKGFSLIELLAVIVVLAIITGIAIVSYNLYLERTREKVYQNYEDGMKEAAMEYIMDTGDMPTSTKKLKINLKYLVGEMDEGKKADRPYIDYFKNPEKNSDKCITDSNGTVSSYVEVSLRPKKETTDGKIDYNKTLEYKVCLICSNYKTEGC